MWLNSKPAKLAMFNSSFMAANKEDLKIKLDA